MHQTRVLRTLDSQTATRFARGLCVALGEVSTRMEAAKIIVVSVLAAIGYGVMHDQVTVRVCLEYFTIGHPPVFPTQDPTLLALGWGIIATWWVGLPLGILLAVVSRRGSQPALAIGQLIKPLLMLLGSMGLTALIAGLFGSYLARNGGASVNEFDFIPQEARVGFVADLWSHTASYASGIIGGLALVVWAARYRRQYAQQTTQERRAHQNSRTS